jgi:molecular chaperone HscB
LRARYLLELANISFNDEVETSQDSLFLMQQMELRESIEEVTDADDPLDALDQIKADVKQQRLALEDAFQQHYLDQQWFEAKQLVLKMRFMERVFSEIQRLEEKLEDEFF